MEINLAPHCELWEPHDTSVVLGRSSTLEREINVDSCRVENIPITRRAGGGCSVVLSPGMIVMTMAYASLAADNAVDHLRWWSRPVVAALQKMGVKDVAFQGTSDLCIGNRKIMGSCLYKGREGYLFQASLLVHCNLKLMERYLHMPPRMPSYRNGRPHGLFVTSLQEQGYPFQCAELMAPLRAELAHTS